MHISLQKTFYSAPFDLEFDLDSELLTTTVAATTTKTATTSAKVATTSAEATMTSTAKTTEKTNNDGDLTTTTAGTVALTLNALLVMIISY